MNPLTNMKNVQKLSEQDLHRNSKSSWHDQYRDSAWIFVGGLPYDLTEGDIVCIFSQYGEIVNINLIRDKDTGKSKGFCFICYEDQRSTVLAVDNLNGIRVLKRIIRVDHVSNYKVPKEGKKTDEVTKKLYDEGCAPKAERPPVRVKSPPPQDLRETLADAIVNDIKLPQRLPIYTVKLEKLDDDDVEVKEGMKSDNEAERETNDKSEEKGKKEKKKDKKHKKKSKKDDRSSDEDGKDKRRKKD